MVFYNNNQLVEHMCSIINKVQIDYIKVINKLKNEIIKVNKKNKVLEDIAFKAIENSENSCDNNKKNSKFYINSLDQMKKDMKILLNMNSDLEKRYSKTVLENKLLEIELKNKKDIISYFESQNYELFVPSYSNNITNIDFDKNREEIIELRRKMKKILKTDNGFMNKINYISDILLKNDFLFNSVSSDLIYYIKNIQLDNIENDNEASPIFFRIFNEISKIIGLE